MKKLLICALFLFALPCSAQVPEGAIVKSLSSPDVYIVKYNAGKQYKRLVLNPLVFKSYGHLKWENLLTIPQEEMNSFVTSDLVRVDGSTDIYELVPEGDNGGKYLLTSTQGYDTNSIYTINQTDFSNYSLEGTKGKVDFTPEILPAETFGEEVKTQIKNDVIKELEDKEAQETEDRQAEASSVLDELNALLDKVNSDFDRVSIRNKEFEDKIAIVHKYGGFSAGLEGAALREEYKGVPEEYERLKAEKEKLEEIIGKVNDYSSDGTALSSADRAYLNSLGISW